MAEMIDKLTPEQEAKLPEYRERGLKLGTSTEPGDPGKAMEAVKAAYKDAKLEPPSVFVFARGPLEGCIMAASFRKIGQEAERLSGSSR